MRQSLCVVIVLAVIASACSNSGETTTTTVVPSTSTTVTTTVTSPTTTTTTTQPSVDVSPLTGLPVANRLVIERRALAIKVDNFPQARPQSDLMMADAVIELAVEGITRLVAIFHTADSERIGPVRSLRPTDYQIGRLLDATLVISGGQDWVISRNQSNGANIIGDVGRPQTFRSSDRQPPHNLYANTAALRDLAERRGYPDEAPQSIWEFGPLPDSSESATEIRLPFTDGLVAEWTWDGARYLRETNGVTHQWVDRNGNIHQIAVDTLVVLRMNTYTMQPPAGGGPAKAVESVGQGAAWVFADGRVVTGTWSRSTPDAPFTLETEEGEVLTVPPGRPWISFLPDGSNPSW